MESLQREYAEAGEVLGAEIPKVCPVAEKTWVALNHPFFVGIFHKPSTHFDFGTNSSGHLQPNSRAVIWFGDLGISSGLVILKDENLHLFRIIHRKNATELAKKR
jgi:hypothetical protein